MTTSYQLFGGAYDGHIEEVEYMIRPGDRIWFLNWHQPERREQFAYDFDGERLNYAGSRCIPKLSAADEAGIMRSLTKGL